MHESTILVTPLPTCMVHTIAILLRDYCAIHDPPTISLLFAIRNTILVVAISISCNGQFLGEAGGGTTGEARRGGVGEAGGGVVAADSGVLASPL